MLPVALHARQAGPLVRTVAAFDAQVEACFADRTVFARGVLGILGLGAPAGSTVVIRATGRDAVAAARAAADVLTTAE